jgi:hypothetical protein
VITRSSTAMIGEISICWVFSASGIVIVGCCATNSPEAENDISRKITNTIRKSMKGISGIWWSTSLRP